MPPPAGTPLGLDLAHTARLVSRAFNRRLAEVGGSLPIWLILIALKAGRPGNQRELAEAVGIQGATLTHHLNAMEAEGLLTRRRDPANRRVHIVQLTDRGEALFHRLRAAAVAHDRRLHRGLDDEDVALLRALLARLRDNVAGPEDVAYTAEPDAVMRPSPRRKG